MLKMSVRRIALLMVVLLVLAACGGGGQSPTATRVPPTATPQAAATDATAEAVETATAEVTAEVTAETTEVSEQTPSADATADVTEAEATAATAEMTESAEATPSSEGTEVAEATGEATEAGVQVNIWEYISTNADFSTLTAAVETAGLAELFSGDDAYTVFAPTNAAFEALPEGALDALLADPAALQAVLRYHALPFELRSNVLKMAGFVRTLQGEEIAVTASAGEIVLNGTARILTANVNVTNGMIHVIDGVLLPPSMQPEATATPAAEATAEGTPDAEATVEATVEATPEVTVEPTEAAEATPEGTPEPLPNTILGITGADPNFTTFVQAVETAGLTDTLSGEGPFIVFVPTNSAFDAVPASLLLDQEALNGVLLYHVVEGDASTAIDGALTTLQGSDLTAAAGVSLTGITVNGVPVIDVLAVDNGVIYVIDQVLLPPDE